MKHNFLIAAALVIAATACTKKQLNTEADNPQATAELTVSLPQVITRASGESDANVKNFQVFIFQDDKLEATSWGPSAPQTLKLTKGVKKVAVLVNHQKINDVSTYDELKARSFDLAANAPNALLMFGEDTLHLSGNRSDIVDVSRLTARVELQKITNALELEAYKDSVMTLKRVYLINAVGERTVAGEYENAKWYNLGKFVSGDCNGLLLEEAERQIQSEGSELNYCFYTYPNSDSSSPVRLVAEIAIGPDTWYYPVTIPVVLANTRYIVSNLKITRIGVDDPDQKIDFANSGVSIEVKPWVDNNVGEVII
ncbi:MAG: fimbrial protein [Candidatus Cryptobacteroides sp.]